MKALIDPTTPVMHIVSWEKPAQDKPYEPVFDMYPNSARVSQVEPDDKTFDITPPLEWVSCSDDVQADVYWFDTVTQVFALIENAPRPTTQGLQQV